MARLSIALALLAMLVGHAVATTAVEIPLSAAPVPVPIPSGFAPGPLPELPLVSKHLAKISGIRMIASNVREAVRDRVDEVAEAFGVNADGVVTPA